VLECQRGSGGDGGLLGAVPVAVLGNGRGEGVGEGLRRSGGGGPHDTLHGADAGRRLRAASGGQTDSAQQGHALALSPDGLAMLNS